MQPLTQEWLNKAEGDKRPVEIFFAGYSFD
jgi:hypothetical protein